MRTDVEILARQRRLLALPSSCRAAANAKLWSNEPVYCRFCRQW